MPKFRVWVSNLKGKLSLGKKNTLQQEPSNSQPLRMPTAIQAILDNPSNQHQHTINNASGDLIPPGPDADSVENAIAILLTTDSLPDNIDQPSKQFIQCMYEKESDAKSGESVLETGMDPFEVLLLPT